MTQVAELRLDDRVQSIARHPVSGEFAAVSVAGDAVRFDAQGREIRRWTPHPPGGVGSAWNRDGNCLATCGQDSAIELVAEKGCGTIRLAGGRGGCECFAWSRDGHRIARASGRRVEVFRAVDGSLLDDGFLAPSTVVDLAWTLDDHLLAASSQGIHRRAADGNAVSLGLSEAVSTLHPSPDGAWLAGARVPSGATLMGLEAGQLLDIAGLQGRLRSLAWSPDGRRLAVASQPCLTVWKIPPPSERDRTPRRLWGHVSIVRWLGFSPLGDRLASIDDEGRILVWNESSDAPAGSGTNPDPPHCACWSADGCRLVVGSVEGALRIHEIG